MFGLLIAAGPEGAIILTTDEGLLPQGKVRATAVCWDRKTRKGDAMVFTCAKNAPHGFDGLELVAHAARQWAVGSSFSRWPKSELLIQEHTKLDQLESPGEALWRLTSLEFQLPGVLSFINASHPWGPFQTTIGLALEIVESVTLESQEIQSERNES